MADLVIRGMEMPASCCDCSLTYYNDQEGGMCCIFTDVLCLGIGRQDNCPLVPLPEGHGRLIDADALREDWLENGENEHVYDTNAMLYSIDNSPTIVPAEGGTDE